MDYYETLPHFFAYFGTVIALAVLFLSVYVMVTPHQEFKLIREGNSAVAIQLVGTFLGFVIPLAMVVAHSVNLLDVVLWGIVAFVVQICTFWVVNTVGMISGISQRLKDGCASSGIFVGGISLGVGILQSVCQIP